MKGTFSIVWSFALCLPLVCFASPAAQPSSNIGKFWHVTDFHYDQTYWTSQLSCNVKVPNPPKFGDYWCDAPWRLVTASIEAMANYDPNVDFLIWTGDTVAHISDDNLTVDLNMDILQNLTQALDSSFPDKKIYATFGNHDYYPANQFPNLNNLIYNRTALLWKNWIEEEAQMDNFRKGGYYTRLVPNTVMRIVSLNTNLYYTSNKAISGIADPSDQIQWLKGVLLAARTADEKVLIVAHIPPGVHTPSRVVWYQTQFNELVMSTLRDFVDVIVGMHFGHDHHDGFKVFYDKQGQPAVPLFVAPSVTPWRYKPKNGSTSPAHNPSVRLVTYDRVTGRQLNIQQLMLDLPVANANGIANFTLLYSFTEHYQVPDISAQSLQQVVTKMESGGTEGDKLLQDYYWFTTAGASNGTCDETCQHRFLCGFKYYEYETFDACVERYVSSASMLTLTMSSAISLVSLVMVGLNLVW